jgi:hypothetical protein
MISNIGFVGNSYKWFVGQVPPGQNQHVKNSSWDDAHGDRVKVRIPGQHPKTAEVTDDNLPWAIVAKPTSSGNINRTSSGVWGGEWVIGFYLDEGCQIPVITQVLGRGAIDSKLVNSINGTTNFENVSSYNGGLQAGNHQLTGGSSKRSDPRTLPIGSDIKDDAKTEPKFDISKLETTLSDKIARGDYTAKDKAEDKLLLRAIQRGELGPVPREQIDAIINRINGVGVRGV